PPQDTDTVKEVVVETTKETPEEVKTSDKQNIPNNDKDKKPITRFHSSKQHEEELVEKRVISIPTEESVSTEHQSLKEEDN
ncbi:hypothetical protein KI387_040214, partial [Taxus chinensis]